MTCTQDNDNFDLVQYHVFVDGDDQIYLGTYTNKNPSVGELRFLFQLDNLKQAYPFGNVSETRNGEIIESKDIWLVEGETRAKVRPHVIRHCSFQGGLTLASASKHYSADRFIDDHVSCAYNDDSSVHACFVKPLRGYEASTGGPFARDINLNVLGDYQSVTYYMNHGDSQDAIRLGFHGPYIFSLSGSEIPTPDDFDIGFIEGLGLPGYVPDKERGTVKGTAFGVQDGFRAVLHWWNDKYQTWTYASDDGSFESPLLPAGDYTQTLYQEELEIGSRSVTVKAGGTVAADIEASSVIVTESRNTVFQIGVYDGTPKGFRNADKQPRMHPSDARMDDWDTETFVVGSSQDDDFPMAIFADMNDDREVQFSLEKGLDAASVLRIATTIAYAGARPQVTANEFECEIPAGPSNTSSRGITKVSFPVPLGNRGKGPVALTRRPNDAGQEPW